MNIYIYDIGLLKNELSKAIANSEVNNFNIVDVSDSADLILSTVYDPFSKSKVKMDFLKQTLEDYPGVKGIFLSWFHPFDDFEMYSNLFSPEHSSCILMDTNKYRILQLPVTSQQILHTMKVLLDIKVNE